MKIDVFAHFYPKRFFDNFVNRGPSFKNIGKRVQAIPGAHDIDARLRTMEEWPELRQVLTLPGPPIETVAGPDKTPEMARLANDSLAELIRQHPDRFIAFGACVPANNIDETLKEIERSVDELGASGIQLYTNVNNKALDAAEFQPIFDEMARRDLPIWLHPTRGPDFPDYLTEKQSQYEIWWAFGWPYDTSVAMARLVFSGLFDRHPDLKIITHHGGGMIPFFEGRVGYGWDELGSRTSDVDYTALRRSMKKRPVDYFRSFYADTAMFGAALGTRGSIEFFGASKVLFASDMPFEPTPGLLVRETIRAIESLGLTVEQKHQVFRGNAERLLKLTVG